MFGRSEDIFEEERPKEEKVTRQERREEKLREKERNSSGMRRIGGAEREGNHKTYNPCLDDGALGGKPGGADDVEVYPQQGRARPDGLAAG